MIKAINTGAGLTVNNSYNSWPTFYNSPMSNGNTLIGQVRYNGSSQNLEVFDGVSWLIMTSTYPIIELAPHVQAVVAWAQKKMAEEDRLKELAEDNPTLKDALDALQRAQEQVKIVATLVTT